MARLDPGKVPELRYSGERSDLTVVVGQKRYDLHVFPMMSHSEYFAALTSSGMSDSKHVQLVDFPGGDTTMDLLADFCYQIPIDDKLTVDNIGHVMCGAHYLRMNAFATMFLPTVRMMADSNMSNCWEILAQCADVMHIANETKVADTCVSSLINHWHKVRWAHGPIFSTWSFFTNKRCLKPVARSVYEWVVKMSSLPTEWISNILSAVAKDPPNSWREMPWVLTGQFLNVLVSQDSLSGAQFLSLLTSGTTDKLSTSRDFFDVTFEALEKAVARTEINKFSEEDIAKIAQQIDFSRVSLDVLKRAASNERMPKQAVLQGSLAQNFRQVRISDIVRNTTVITNFSREKKFNNLKNK